MVGYYKQMLMVVSNLELDVVVVVVADESLALFSGLSNENIHTYPTYDMIVVEGVVYVDGEALTTRKKFVVALHCTGETDVSPSLQNRTHFHQ